MTNNRFRPGALAWPALIAIPFLIAVKLPVLQVREIRVEGVPQHYVAELTQYLVPLLGSPLFSIDGQMVQACFDDRWVRCVEVRKTIPSTITVRLEPRVAFVDCDGTWFDRSGYIADVRMSSPPPIRVAGADGPDCIANILLLCHAAPALLAEHPEIRVLGPHHWVLSGHGPEWIHMDPDQVETSTAALARIEDALDPGTPVDVDLRVQGRVIVRRRED